MATRHNSLDDAIATARRMAEIIGGCYVVVTFRGGYRVVCRRTGLPESRIVWRSWGTRAALLVQDTPENRRIVESNTLSHAARLLGCSIAQVDYARKKYGWTSKKQGPFITDIEGLRAAMKVMSASAYAREHGLHRSTVVSACSRHNIPITVREPRGRRNGARGAPTPTLAVIEHMRKHLAYMTAREYSLTFNMHITAVYARCRKYNIPRPVRTRGKPCGQ